LFGCDSGGNQQTQTVSSPPDTLPASIVPNVAYWGINGSMDSVTTPVSARLFLAMGPDSTFWMYMSPASLPLYHGRSPFDLFRLTGKMQQSTAGSSGSVTFLVDSTKSFFNDGNPVRKGSVFVQYQIQSTVARYVKFSFLSENENVMAYGEYGVNHVDSTYEQMYPILDQ
jgi:hypothetical protein